MKAIYLDTFAGISGNMLLGALLDAGYPLEALRSELQKLHLGAYELIYKKVNKLGIEATYFNVLLPEEHEHSHDHEHEHEHHHEEHEHSHQHEHEHHHEENTHIHAHTHTHVHRNLQDIMEIINASELSVSIKSAAEKVFRAIAEAEAKVHGKTVEEVHFHEVGAIDTIIDVVGCLLGLEYLQIEKIFVGTVTTGFGFVQCAHGLMPVPAPATAELLQKLPQRQGQVAKEMTTPTGAALLNVLAEYSEGLPQGWIGDYIAYGAGTRDVEIPNVLRMYVGKTEQQKETVVEAACNLDDVSGEIFGYAAERLLAAGALDVWTEQIIMKKGRPACKLMFLCEKSKLNSLMAIVFAETGTLGVRYHEVQRSVLERGFVQVDTSYGTVRVKYGKNNDVISSLAPEYEDCKQTAAEQQVPLKVVYEAARKAAEEKLHG